MLFSNENGLEHKRKLMPLFEILGESPLKIEIYRCYFRNCRTLASSQTVIFSVLLQNSACMDTVRWKIKHIPNYSIFLFYCFRFSPSQYTNFSEKQNATKIVEFTCFVSQSDTPNLWFLPLSVLCRLLRFICRSMQSRTIDRTGQSKF